MDTNWIEQIDKLPTRPRKAVAAFVGTLAVGAVMAWLDGSLTRDEIATALSGAAAAMFAVWRIPNPLDRRKLRRQARRGRQPGPGDV